MKIYFRASLFLLVMGINIVLTSKTFAIGTEDAKVDLTIKAGSQTVQGVVGIPPSAEMIKVEAGASIQIVWAANMTYEPNFGPDGATVDAGYCFRIPNGVFQQYFWVIGGMASGYSQYVDLATRPQGNVWVELNSPGYYSFGIQCSYMTFDEATKGRKMASDVKTVTIAVSAKDTNGCVPTNTCWKTICAPQTCTECGQKYNGPQCSNSLNIPPVCVCRAACLPVVETLTPGAAISCPLPSMNQKCCLVGTGGGNSGVGAKPVQPTTDPTLITSFSANTNSLTTPGPITLSWVTSASTTTCTASGGWGGSVTPLPAGTSTQTITSTINFYLECFNAAGTSSGERVVTVALNEPCVPDTSCAANTCTTATCQDSCGTYIPGTKDCTPASCTPDTSCQATTCMMDVCSDGCGTYLPGTLECTTPSTDCAVGSCKGSCDTATENKTGTCNNGQGSCCQTRPPSTPENYIVPIGNPLAFNTVEGLLNSILGFLQGIIVILSIIMIVIGSIIYMTAAGNESKVTTGKTIIAAALIGLALALAAPSFLKQIGEILGWSGTNGSAVSSSKTIAEILTNILNFLLSVIGVIGIIMLVIGGLMYLTAAGDEDRIKTGKKIVTYSLIGIAVALAALVIVTQVAGLFV